MKEGGRGIAARRNATGADRCAVGVFVRAPVPGETKTRLIPRLGPEGAARFYLASLLDTLDMVRSTKLPRIVFCTPASARRALRNLGVEEETVGQGGGDLGQRMQRALLRLLATPSVDRAIVIGTDSPDLPSSLLRDAGRVLRRSPATLAPATDGGYTLVGVRGETVPEWKTRGLFSEIPWSSPRTLEATVEQFVALGIPPRILSPWWDVDEPDDLTALARRLRVQERLGTLRAVRTAELLRGLEH